MFLESPPKTMLKMPSMLPPQWTLPSKKEQAINTWQKDGSLSYHWKPFPFYITTHRFYKSFWQLQVFSYSTLSVISFKSWFISNHLNPRYQDPVKGTSKRGKYLKERERKSHFLALSLTLSQYCRAETNGRNKSTLSSSYCYFSFSFNPNSFIPPKHHPIYFLLSCPRSWNSQRPRVWVDLFP